MNFYDAVDDETKINKIIEKLFLLETQVIGLQAFLEEQFRNLDLKKMKRNRTQKNRCQFFNHKKGKKCFGYVTTNSQSLCYAHHMKALGEDETKTLFMKKNEEAKNNSLVPTYNNSSSSDTSDTEEEEEEENTKKKKVKTTN